MPLRRTTELCEICDKKKFILSLRCQHKICLDCKLMIKKVEPNPKCPFCRVLFDENAKVIEEPKHKHKQMTRLDVDQLIADLNWELYSGKKEIEYNSEFDEGRAWTC